MPRYPDRFKNTPLAEDSQKPTILELYGLTNILERDFFSKVKVDQHISESKETTLVIEVTCDMSLAELLFHFNREAWGHFKDGESTLSIALNKLNDINSYSADIEELSLLLKDTSIIIDRIYKNSISDQFQNILIELGKHYVRFTKELKEIPFEIFMPVYEVSSEKDDMLFSNRPIMGNRIPKDYYNYWGLYFDQEENALVYDLENTSLIFADLYMQDR